MSTAVAPVGRETSAAVKAWLVVAAVACFVAFLGATAYQPELAAGQDVGGHALSRSPTGFAGLVRLLRADGATVRFNRRRQPGRTVQSDALLVLTPRANTPLADIRRLAHGRRVLLIAGKWIPTEAPGRPGVLAAAGRWPGGTAAAQIAAVLAPDAPGSVRIVEAVAPSGPLTVKAPQAWADPRWRPQPARGVKALRTLAGPNAQPEFVDARERILVAMAPADVSYATADPDLFDNHALLDAAGARTTVSMVEEMAAGGTVVFDLTLPGVSGARSPLRLAFAPPFLPATAAAVLLAALLGLMARDGFGALRRRGRPYAFGKRALVDTTASLIAVVAREPRLAERYAELARSQALQAVGAAPGEDQARADAAVDRIGRERGVGAWTPLAAEARTIGTRAALMAFARRVHHWRTEMTLGRG